MESSLGEQKELQKKTEKDVKLLIKSNERMVRETSLWRQDLNSIAMVQSCQAEYLSMQSLMDQVNYKSRLHLHAQLDSHSRALRHL